MFLDIIKEFDETGDVPCTKLKVRHATYQIVVAETMAGGSSLRVYDDAAQKSPILVMNANHESEVREIYANVLRYNDIEQLRYSFLVSSSRTCTNAIQYIELSGNIFKRKETMKIILPDVYSSDSLFQLETIVDINTDYIVMVKDYQKKLESLGLKKEYICTGMVKFLML